MLTVGIEDDHKIDLSIQSAAGRTRRGEPMPKAGFDRFAFAAILRVNDHLGARFAGALGSLVARAIIDNQNMFEFVTRPMNNVANMFLFVESRDERRGCRSYSRGRVLHHQRTTG
jgi:hypothetical protein